MSAHPYGMRPSNGYETPTDEVVPVTMRAAVTKASVCLVILTLLAPQQWSYFRKSRCDDYWRSSDV